MSDTKILPCVCFGPFQDDRYGTGKRVHNQTMKGWRCTSCGREKDGPPAKKEGK